MAEFQRYVADMVIERCFQDETVPEVMMLFLEECGEMAKAARNQLKTVKSDEKSEKLHLESEVADIFMYLLIICNKFGVDLEKAFRDKEELNKIRKWK